MALFHCQPTKLVWGLLSYGVTVLYKSTLQRTNLIYSLVIFLHIQISERLDALFFCSKTNFETFSLNPFGRWIRVSFQVKKAKSWWINLIYILSWFYNDKYFHFLTSFCLILLYVKLAKMQNKTSCQQVPIGTSLMHKNNNEVAKHH